MVDDEEISDEERELEEESLEVTDKMGRVVELPIPYDVSGTVYIVHMGSRQRILHSGRKNLKLSDGDKIITENGFFWSLGDAINRSGSGGDLTRFIMFPNSELELSAEVFEKENEKVTGHSITGIKFVKGLFWFRVNVTGDLSRKVMFASGYPEIEFKPSYGEFTKRKEVAAMMELSNGTITIFGMSGRVIHKKLGVDARTGWSGTTHGKITITNNAMYLTNLAENPDKRVSLIAKTINFMLTSGAIGSDKPAEPMDLPPYSPVLEEDRVVKKAVSRSIKGEEETVDEYWTNERKREEALKDRIKTFEKEYKEKMGYDYAPQSLKNQVDQDILKKLDEFRIESAREWKRSGEEFKVKQRNLIEAGKKGITATTKTVNIDQKFVYRNVSFDFTKAERGIEMGMRKAKSGKEFLMVRFNVSNTSGKQLFFSPDEEFRAIADGQIIPLENYKLETNMDAGYSNEGHLLFIIPETAHSFIVEFGTKTKEKTSINVSI